MKGIVGDCLAEMLDRKVIYVFLAITVFGALAILGSRAVDMHIQGQGIDLNAMNDMLSKPLLLGFNMFMYILVFMAVMGTAGLIPNMLIRGRADFYLSKPISRTVLLTNKVFGIWVVYGGVMVACVLIELLVAGIVYGTLSAKIIYIIAINLLTFLVWLSVTAFAGVVTGSGTMSMMAAFVVWLAQRLLTYHDAVKNFVDSRPVTLAMDILYYIFPKTGEMYDLTDQLATGTVTGWLPLYSSLAFAVVLFAVTIMVFNRKDY